MTAATEWYNAGMRGETPLPNLPVDDRDFPAADFKYADVDFVYPRTNGLVKTIIENTPLSGDFKRVLIDVKVQDLTPQLCSCKPGWHLDGSMREFEIHHLCVLNGPLTEFIDEPLHLPTDYPENVKLIPASVKTRAIRPNHITTFSSLDFHRGVYATKPTRRLLVRLTETNVIMPCNQTQLPSRGARRGPM